MEEKSLFTYWKECYTQKYCSFEGRARRKEFWGFTLFQILFALPLNIWMQFSVDPRDLLENPFAMYLTIPGIIMMFVVLLVFLPALGLQVRRMHDIGKSGWWLLIAFVPLIGAIALLIFMCLDGNPQTNKYGEDPKGRGVEA